MDVQELWAEFDTLCRDDELSIPSNLAGRVKALALVSYIGRVALTRRHQAELRALQQQANGLQQRLQAINTALFQAMRTDIQSGRYTPQTLRLAFDPYTSYRPDQPGQAHFGHEALDILLQGILECEPLPEATQLRSEEMIHFERTPVSAILELTDRVHFAPDQTFYDLGSGLGQVVILVNLLTGVKARGVEFEPAYHHYAQRRVCELDLTSVELINADAQGVDLSDGHVFFMFTPFTGAILQTVLAKLHEVARLHPIILCTYGPCTPMVALQPWLQKMDENFNHEFKLALFQSTEQIG